VNRTTNYLTIERYKLLPTIDEKLKSFANDPKQRLKQNTPNLGDWLTYLTVSPDARWENVCVTFVRFFPLFFLVVSVLCKILALLLELTLWKALHFFTLKLVLG
jgi:hypothetical protein